jgi:hypothetical protein
VPSESVPSESVPDQSGPDKSAPAKEAALAQAAASDGGSAGERELEPTARGIPVARVPVPAKQVPDKAVPGQGGAGESAAAPAAASSPAAGPGDTDQYAKTSLTSSGAILAAAESKSAAAAASSPAGSAAGTGSPAGNATGSESAAGSGTAGHEVTVKASTAAPASAASSGSAAPEPTVKVSTPPATPSPTVKATTPQAPPAPKPAPPKPTPPAPSEKDAWWSNAYQTQGPSFSPTKNRPAAPPAPAQPGPASPFSQPTQYAPPGRYTSPGRPPGPATTSQSPQNYNYQYPAGFNPDGSGGRVQPTPPRKGSAGKKILLGILAVIVVAAVVVAATILGKHHASTPNAANSSTPAGSNGPATSAGPAPGGPVPPVTRDTPTVVRAIDDHSDTVPGGYTPYTLHPSAAGTTAGFMLDVPPGWQVAQQTHQRIFFNAPGGLSNVEVDLTPHTKPDMVAEAQFLKQRSVGQGKFPQYKQLELGPENVLGTRGALWRFDWTNPKTGRQMRVDDMLFVLQTPNGPQSYAIFMTAPDGTAAGSWNATILPIIANMLQSFKETTS